jgi:hypothetical protein
MDSRIIKNHRFGLVLIITAAIVGVVLFFPGIALSIQPTFTHGKDPSAGIFKVGEVVTFTGSVLFNGSAQETSNIDVIRFTIAPDTSDGEGGSESFSASLPFSVGNHNLTSLLPSEMQTRGSTLEVDVSWTDLGPNTGGYSYGYKGSTVNAEMNFAIEWLPAVLKVPPPAPPPDITAPDTLFQNPGGEVATEDAIEATFEFMGPTIPEPGAEILGLAFDRYYWVLKVLTDDPDPAEGDWVVEMDPETGRYMASSNSTGPTHKTSRGR